MRTLLLFSIIGLITACTTKAQVETVENTPSANLGEGAIWHPEKEALMWVDITEGKVFMYKPEEGMKQNIQLESMVGTVVPASDNYFAVVAQETGIFGINQQGKTFKVADFPENALTNMRFNDGKCDPRGRLWVGTMRKQIEEGTANLYMLDGDSLIVKQSGVTISNGIVWDTSKNVMYYIDTPTQNVYAYDYEPETGEITNQRVVIRVPKEKGSPDGMSIDSEGKLWIAHWGGKGVYRWDPESGELLQKIEVPAPNVTSCAFGGDDLKTLYITTAKLGLSDDQLNEYPLSGSLFKIRTDIKGIDSYMYSSAN